MNYTDPHTVTSPQEWWELNDVIYDSKEGGWSVARGKWDDKPVLAIRWNGEGRNVIGHPQSRGLPVWFIVPGEVAGVLREVIALLPKP